MKRISPTPLNSASTIFRSPLSYSSLQLPPPIFYSYDPFEYKYTFPIMQMMAQEEEEEEEERKRRKNVNIWKKDAKHSLIPSFDDDVDDFPYGDKPPLSKKDKELRALAIRDFAPILDNSMYHASPPVKKRRLKTDVVRNPIIDIHPFLNANEFNKIIKATSQNQQTERDLDNPIDQARKSLSYQPPIVGKVAQTPNGSFGLKPTLIEPHKMDEIVDEQTMAKEYPDDPIKQKQLDAELVKYIFNGDPNDPNLPKPSIFLKYLNGFYPIRDLAERLRADFDNDPLDTVNKFTYGASKIIEKMNIENLNPQNAKALIPVVWTDFALGAEVLKPYLSEPIDKKFEDDEETRNYLKYIIADGFYTVMKQITNNKASPFSKLFSSRNVPPDFNKTIWDPNEMITGYDSQNLPNPSLHFITYNDWDRILRKVMRE